jgi:two-component system sensor histidine kinase YesM
MSFKKRLMLFFVLNSFVPIITIGIFTYLIYSKKILDMAEKSATETIDIVCSDIESLFSDTYSLCIMTANDINIHKYLRMDFNTISEQYSTDLEGSMELASISTYRDDIFGIYVLGDNGGCYKSNYSSFKIEDQRTTNWYQQIIENDDAVWFVPHEGSFVVKSSINDRFISVGIPYINKASGQKSGVVVADINEDVITNSIQYGLTNGFICIIDETGKIITKSDNIYCEKLSSKIQDEFINSIQNNVTKESSPYIVSDEDYLIICRQLNNTGWWVAGIMDKGLVTQSNHSITYMVLIALLIVTIASSTSGALISDSISRPVRQLTELMEKVEVGDFEIRVDDPYHDEFGRLSQSFNHMLNEIQSLMDRIYQDQRKLRRSELNALYSQIQPHFLYNSMDSITWLLRLGKVDEAQHMLSALSTFFTVSLSKGQEIITIQQEIQHVSSYLVIENMIYSKKFEYEIQCNSTLFQYKTLKLLLQPLVENAINHSIPKNGEKIHLCVHVHEADNELILSVEDKSMGLTEEQLEQMLRKLTEPSFQDASSHQGYGLYNVNERIHIFWGKEYGIHVTSKYEEGTAVSIHIPKLKGDDNFVSGNPL